MRSNTNRRIEWTIQELLEAATSAEPLSVSPHTAELLRVTNNVSRTLLAAAVQCGYQSILRHERGYVGHSLSLDGNDRYARCLGAFAERLRHKAPILYRSISATPKPEPVAV